METMYFFAPEMEYRQGRFAREGVRGIDAYNAKSNDRLPAIVMVIDADDRTAAFPFIEGMRPALQNARAAGIFAVFVSRSAVEDFSVTSFLTAAFTPWSVLRLTPRRKAGKGTVATLVHLAGAVLLVRHDGRGRRRFAHFAGDRPPRHGRGGCAWKPAQGIALSSRNHASPDAPCRPARPPRHGKTREEIHSSENGSSRGGKTSVQWASRARACAMHLKQRQKGLINATSHHR